MLPRRVIAISGPIYNPFRTHMIILLFGKNGQIGWELQRSLAPLGEVISLGRHDDLCGDFSRPEGVIATVRAIAPDVIVNAAAYTAVDMAETETAEAMMINATVPGLIAAVAAELGSWLVHYSTDYVFGGGGTSPWQEEDIAKPLNHYGQTKFLGEENIRAAGCKHLIFRTSWVYARRGRNFARSILRAAQERDTLEVVNDQYGAPTGADLLADLTSHAIRYATYHPAVAGTYHVAAEGETTWYEYARHIIARARAANMPLRVQDSGIRAVPSTSFPSQAKRPSNSRLNTHKLCTTFSLHLPSWRAGVDHMLDEVLST